MKALRDKSGFPTAYGFACGETVTVEGKLRDCRLTLSQRNGVYLIAGFDFAGRHVSHSFRSTVRNVRHEFKTMCFLKLL